MFKIIFIDIDGTLLNSNHLISGGTITAIRRVTELFDIPIVLTSARPPQAIESIYKQLNLTSPIICFNGALIKEKPERNQSKTLYSSTINASLINDFIEIVTQKQLSINLYHHHEWYCSSKDQWVLQEESICGTKANIQNINIRIKQWAEQNSGPHKILLMGNPAQLDTIIPTIKYRFEKKLNINKSKSTYLELIDRSASKALAMRLMMDKLSISRNEVMAIGDNHNDIEMLEFAGMGIAMGNSPDEVKFKSNFVTLDNDSEGLRFALDKFIK